MGKDKNVGELLSGVNLLSDVQADIFLTNDVICSKFDVRSKL